MGLTGLLFVVLSLKRIRPGELGLVYFEGFYRGRLLPGTHWVSPVRTVRRVRLEADGRTIAGTTGETIPVADPPTDLVRVFRASQSVFEARSVLNQVGFMKTGVARVIALTGGLMAFLEGIAVLLALGSYSEGQLSPSQFTLLVVTAVALGAFVAWGEVLSLTTYGVEVADSGLVVYERNLDPRTVRRWTLAWKDMAEAKVIGFGIRVDRETQVGLPGARLSVEQARIVLADPRCPLNGRLSPRVLQRISPGHVGPPGRAH